VVLIGDDEERWWKSSDIIVRAINSSLSPTRRILEDFGFDGRRRDRFKRFSLPAKRERYSELAGSKFGEENSGDNYWREDKWAHPTSIHSK
jgi:dTDP-4-dehydrorhamnose reductase